MLNQCVLIFEEQGFQLGKFTDFNQLVQKNIMKGKAVHTATIIDLYFHCNATKKKQMD
jgi:hypothetical protein